MKVTVLVVTYNHERFIDQALESVISQRVAFDFEIIVSEDASTDKTREIVLGWRDRYPDRIRLLLSEHNLHSNEVVARGFRVAQGEYLALIDGDDYWTRRDKLMIQTAFLDANPGVSLCFHNAEVLENNDMHSARLWTNASQPERSGLQELWSGNPFATCSSMFRCRAVQEIPAWYADFFPITDWPLYLLWAEQGDVAFLNETMGAYRLHAGGLYSVQPTLSKLEATDDFYRRIGRCFDGRYNDVIREAHYRYFADWAHEYAHRGEMTMARRCIRIATQWGGLRRASAWVGMLGLAIRVYGPWPRSAR